MTKKDFLTNEVPRLLQQLKADKLPNFGLMTPQHMVEHLCWVAKASVKFYGEAPTEPTKGQLGFKKFIAKGAILEHRPSSKTKADLPALKYDSLETAVAQVPEAIDRFYRYFAAHPDTEVFNPMFGKLNFEELELFHYQHYRYHLWQFNLLENYN